MICDTCKYVTDEGCDNHMIDHQIVDGEVIDCTGYKEDEPNDRRRQEDVR